MLAVFSFNKKIEKAAGNLGKLFLKDKWSKVMKAGIKEKGIAISENFSEKKKRGRPRLFHPEYEKVIRRGREYTDIRTIYNQEYETRAFTVLGLSPKNPPDFPFSWLGDESKIEVGKSRRCGFRKTILSELGRIDNDSNLIEAAKEICRLKPKTQDAVKMIRGWRLRRAYAPVSLESSLRKAIEDYRKNHPDIKDKDIYETLCSLEEEYFQKSLFGN